MKQILLLITFFLCCGYQGFCTAATFVTGASHQCLATDGTGTNNNVICTISGAGSGHWIGFYVVDQGDSGGGSMTLSDDAGTVQTTNTPPFTGSSPANIRFGYVENTTSGIHNLKLSCQNLCNATVQMYGFEYSGVPTSASVDTNATASGAFNPCNTGSITTAADNEVVISLCIDGTNTTALSAPAGFAIRNNTSTGGTSAVMDNAAVDNTGSGAAGSAVAPSWTITPSAGFWAAYNVAFKAAVVGATANAKLIGHSTLVGKASIN